MPNRLSSPVLRRAVGAAFSGLILAGVLLPGAALAGPGSPPAPVADVISTVKNVPISGNVLTNDDNPGEGTLTVVATGALSPTVGTLVIAANGNYTFTPALNFVGTGTTTYSVANDKHTRPAGITINVADVPHPPVANDDTVSVDEDTATNVSSQVLGNDTDVDGDTLSITDVSNVTGGQASVSGGVLTFTGDADDCGPASGSFDYTISDGLGGSDTGHADVNVTCANDDPVAGDDDASGTEDTDVTISDADLLLNDADVDGTPAVTGVGSPLGGTVSLDAGTITFVPAADLCGDDAASFEYTVEDGDGGSTTGTVTIDLTCVNDDPIAGDDDATVVEDTATDVTASLLGNDTDVDTGDTLEVTGVSNATGGDVDLTDGVVTFTPAADLCGDNEGGFDYELSDGTGTDTGHVTVDITCVNDDPVAGDDDASGTEDTDVTISDADLLLNDADVDGTPAVTGVGSPLGGTVSLDAGTITFVPAADLCGDDAASFEYTVEDGDGGSTTGTVTIDLTCVNDLPVAVADTASVAANSPFADHDVLDNDSDPDTTDTLTIESAAVSSAAGTTSVVGGMVRFTPKTGYNGPAVITYVISDGTDTASTTLTITVGGDVAGPVVTAATVAFATGRVDQTAPLKITWSATDVPSGVAQYQVQVSIARGPYKSVYSGTGTSIVKYYPFKQRLVFRTRAMDTLGNWSAWVTSSPRKIVSYQNTSRYVAYMGTWHQVNQAKSSGKGYAYTTQKGAKARLTFSGRSVLYVAPKTPTSGKVKVYIDGKLVGRFDLSRSSARVGQIISRATWSAKGTHTIRVVADSGSSKRESFDAFIVLK